MMAEMTPAQKKKREEIVLAMKGSKKSLKDKYGDDWKSVVYATATKLAMKESTPCRGITEMKYEREDLEFLQSALADKDIDSSITMKGLTVPKESLQKAKQLVKKLGYDVPVMSGLHEGLPTFQEFVSGRLDEEDEEDEDSDDESEEDEDEEDEEDKD